ncbi:hypothetical protein [Photobacterium halotolerans]|uniref:hypothetical protein n=1 Tax=Photobacterium halotolerans TaxID=265726 RepID=UPI000421F84A|nr:hypothetical protein [Photobacterium halotolerans]
MLESVLGMYSVPAGPLWRTLSSGLLTAESLKTAGVVGERASVLGWNVIKLQAGDKKAGTQVARVLVEQKFHANDILVVIKCLLADRNCPACHGTGKVWSPRGHRFKKCDRCQGEGHRPIPLEQMIKNHNANKAKCEAAITLCLMAQADSEKAIKVFLKKEKLASV